MSLILNLIWLVFGGFVLFLGYLLAGVIMCVTVIGIPLGLANFKLIPVSLLPLGKDIVGV